MRTALFLIAGVLLMASLLIPAKLFVEHLPWAPNVALVFGLAVWLAIVGVNMWLGVSKAGYSVAEETPILLLLFIVPAALAILFRWRFV